MRWPATEQAVGEALLALPEMLSEADLDGATVAAQVRRSVSDLSTDQMQRLRALARLISSELDLLYPEDVVLAAAADPGTVERELDHAERRALRASTRLETSSPFSSRVLEHLETNHGDARSCVALVAPSEAAASTSAVNMDAHVVPQKGFDRKQGLLSSRSGSTYQISRDGRFIRDIKTHATVPFSANPISLGGRAIGFPVGEVLG